MQGFTQILRWQMGMYFISAALAGWALLGQDGWLSGYLTPSSTTLVAVILLVVSVTHFLGNILHELYEINDQLAGRAKEFRDVIRGK